MNVRRFLQFKVLIKRGQKIGDVVPNIATEYLIVPVFVVVNPICELGKLQAGRVHEFAALQVDGFRRGQTFP